MPLELGFYWEKSCHCDKIPEIPVSVSQNFKSEKDSKCQSTFIKVSITTITKIFLE